VNLLARYHISFVGAVIREAEFQEIDAWFPIGWIRADQVRNYPHGTRGTQHDGGRQIIYPFPAFQITTADLRDLDQLKDLVRRPRPAQ
jgi:hypothetical protein